MFRYFDGDEDWVFAFFQKVSFFVEELGSLWAAAGGKCFVEIDYRGFLIANGPASEIVSSQVKIIPRWLGVITFIGEKIEAC
jgi:hypothetical protein